MNNAGKWACDRHTENADFSDEVHFDLCKQAKLLNLGHQKTRTHTLKSRRTQNEFMFGADFGPEA